MNELALLDYIQGNLHQPWLDPLMVAVTLLGNAGLVWLIIGAVLLGFRSYRRTGAAVLLAVVAAAVLSKLLIGEIVMRPRPCDVNPAVALLIDRPLGTSFPSGHAATSFAGLGALIAGKTPKRIVIPSAVLAVAIGLSRLYLYVHYPTDVLAGAVLGLVVGWACFRAVVLFEARREKKRAPSDQSRP